MSAAEDYWNASARFPPWEVWSPREGESKFDPENMADPNYWLRLRGPEPGFVRVGYLGEPSRTTRLGLAKDTLRFIALAQPNLVLRMRLRSCKPEERCGIEMPEAFLRCLLPPRHPGLHVAQTKEHEHYYGPIVAVRYSIEVDNPLSDKVLDTLDGPALW